MSSARKGQEKNVLMSARFKASGGRIASFFHILRVLPSGFTRI